MTQLISNNNDSNDNKDNDETFISHLEALRTMLLNSIKAVLFLSPIGFWAASKCINFLVNNSLPDGMTKLHYFAPMEVFILQIKAGVVIAFILAFPFIASEIKKFITPALYEHERKFLTLLTSVSVGLFIFGALFCVFFIIPLVMNFSAGFSTNQIEATLGLGNFINISAGLTLAFGLMFQFPLLILLAVKFNLIETSVLKDKRPYVVVIILILAALLTPPDIVSQLMLAVPTYLLFEIGLFAAAKIEKNNKNN